MNVTFLSSKGYSDPHANNGDCILIDSGDELIIFDCGCEEHAKRVLDYMKKHHYSKAKLILSHNDSDHFNGIPYLLEQNAISDIYTLLLLKYKTDLLNRINDNRLSKQTIAERIEEIFDNIYALSGQAILHDIFVETDVCTGVTIVGPDKDYALDAVAKRIDNRESDTIDKETVVNAVSVQVKIDFDNKKHLFLCGDSSYEAIKENLQKNTYSFVQLPHHGKLEQADMIFKQLGSFGITYYVSDNTGDSNGGSANLPSKGYAIKNTLAGDQTCKGNSISPIGCYDQERNYAIFIGNFKV